MRMTALIVLAFVAAGCGGGEVRTEQPKAAAAFDTGCPSMKMIQQVGEKQFKFQGCGRDAVYECQNTSHAGIYQSSNTFVENTVYDEAFIERRCRPAPAGEDVVPAGTAPPQVRRAVTVSAAPAAEAPEDRSREDVRAVMEPLVETARASCPTGPGNDGLVEMKLYIEPTGHVGQVEILNATSSEQTAKCLAGMTMVASFPPTGRPDTVTVVYPVIFGDPEKVPDLMKHEIDAVMEKVTATARASCPTGPGHDGAVVLGVTIGQSGRTQKVEIVKSSASEAAAKCLVGIALTAAFPALRKSQTLLIHYEVAIEAPQAVFEEVPLH